MGVLIFAYRKLDIIRRRIDLEYKSNQLRKLLYDLQSYAANIADGEVSFNDLSSAPASIFNKMSNYMITSHNGSMTRAQQQFFMYQQAGQFNNIPPQNQEAYKQIMLKNLYEQERERYQKVEEKILNAKEKKIALEQGKIDSQLKMLNEEYASVEKAEAEAIKLSTPKYGLG